MAVFLTKKTKNRRGDLSSQPADYESAAIPLSHDGKCTGIIKLRAATPP